VFYRGNDVYDRANVGFVRTSPTSAGADSSGSTRRCRANGNGGHEDPHYGTDLSQQDKAALSRIPEDVLALIPDRDRARRTGN
jgi:hypothetical protein